jgi:hypothetical protein
MDPDSVYRLGYEYYNSGDDKNWEVIKNYALVHGSKFARWDIALDKIHQGNILEGEKILKLLFFENFGPAYAEYGLCLLKKKDPNFIFYIDTAINFGEDYLIPFLGDL